MSQHHTVEVLVETLGRRLFDILDLQDWEGLDGLVSDGLVVQLGTATNISYQQWRDNLQTIYQAFPDGHHVIHDWLADDRRFVTRCQFEGTHAGLFQGIEPTHRTVSVSVIHIDYFADGLLVEHHGQLDVHGLLTQLGVT